MAIIPLEVVQAFIIYEVPSPPNPQGVRAEDTLGFIETIVTNRKSEQVIDTLQMRDLVSCRRSIANLQASNTLYLNQRGARSNVESIVQNLAMWDTAENSKAFEQLVQKLGMLQTALASVAKPGRNTFTMTQSATYTARRNITVTQTFEPISSGKGYKPNPNYIAISQLPLGGPNGTPSDVF